MNETVLDVLMYLFDHYFEEDVRVESDQESLTHDLARAGFPEPEISKAFAWLEGLALQQKAVVSRKPGNGFSNRVYTAREAEKLNVTCRGFLLSLEQIDVLDAMARELVIERVMALETDEISLEQLKWVIPIILFNQPGKEQSLAWMEALVLEETSGQLH